MAALPAGWRFMPDDQELVEYLRDHGRGRARFSGAINEGIDPYSCHPEYLLSCFPDVSEYGSNYYYANREGRNRQTDDRSGHWINRRQDPIHKDGQIVGYKRRFTFYLGPGKSNKTDWLMTEYTSDDTPKAICVIYRTTGSQTNQNGQPSTNPLPVEPDDENIFAQLSPLPLPEVDDMVFDLTCDL